MSIFESSQVPIELQMKDVLSHGIWTYGDRCPTDWQRASLLDPFAPQHYRLLNYLAASTRKNVAELGTGTRLSTLCLAAALDGQREVWSTDIEYPADADAVDLSGMPVHLKNLHCVPFIRRLYLPDFDFIFIDVDHRGPQARKVLDYLAEKGWVGLVLLDDARAGKKLKEMLNEKIVAGLEVYDLTRWGHWSGSLLVNFGMNLTVRCGDLGIIPA
jgi:predicted O-methyltransferase YrrM